MPSFKSNRGAEDIKREIAMMIRELKDPRVSPMLSVVKAEVSSDLTYAKIYVSDLNGLESCRRSVEGLKSASGFIRRELSNRLKMRKAPELKFIADDSLAHSAEINRILTDIMAQEKKEPPDGEKSGEEN